MKIDFQQLATLALDHYKYHPMYDVARKRYNDTYYPYIPSYSSAIETVLNDLHDRDLKLEDLRFIDIGCGLPAIPDLMRVFRFGGTYGLEYNETIASYFRGRIIQGDLLTYNFKEFDVLYSYNPINETATMEEGLRNIINTMKSGALFYFCAAACDPRKVSTDFKSVNNSSVYTYEKK